MKITVLCAALLTGSPLTDSLPRTSGEIALAGLDQPVEVKRDAFGVPAIHGATRADVFRGLGFVHAQERYFQMDMARRLAAGELSAVAGPRTLASDRRNRMYRFRTVAEGVVEAMPPTDRALLAAYTAGANAGLDDLGAPPPEYTFIQATPEPWCDADSVLVLLAMFDMLNFSQGDELAAGVMKETLPPALYAFLTPASTRFDAPLPAGDGNDHRPAPIPGPGVIDVRGRAAVDVDARPLAAHGPGAGPLPGSNNWAVAAVRGAGGRAIVANDPHLALTAPGIWYRAQLNWGDDFAAGVTLPGVPGIIIGSNGHVAWGFTNTMIDVQDLVVVDVDPGDPDRYRGPDGAESFGVHVERIEVRGGEPVELTLRTTRWGAVTRTDHRGRPLVLRWPALDADTVNFGNLHLAKARTIDALIEIGRRAWGPSQNLVGADATGRIGWTVTGYLPHRAGFDGSVPVSWADGETGWLGPRDETERPTIIDPTDGILFTANNRTVPLDRARSLAASWAPGMRAQRIGERLAGTEPLDEHDLLAIQLDTRVAFYDLYRDLALAALESDPNPDETRATALAVLTGWNGTADAAQTAVALLASLRRGLANRVFAPLTAPCRDADASFRYRWLMAEEPLRRILEERPAHLLPPGFADWETVLARAVDDAIAVTLDRAPATGLRTPWSDWNRARIRHPLADAAPAFAGMLNMPDDPLPGHYTAVRVATPTFGASMRMVVSPSHEAEGIMHIPAGQSGHPMSPDYRSSHAAWLEGRATPFLAGDAVATLVLKPAG